MHMEWEKIYKNVQRRKKEEIKCNNVIKQYKNDSFWWCYKRKHKKQNPNWSRILGHPYRILIFGDSGSEKMNYLSNLINHQADIDKIYLHAKNPYEAKYQLLIKNKKVQAESI